MRRRARRVLARDVIDPRVRAQVLREAELVVSELRPSGFDVLLSGSHRDRDGVLWEAQSTLATLASGAEKEADLRDRRDRELADAEDGTCDELAPFDFGWIGCDLEADHRGSHESTTLGVTVKWVRKHTGGAGNFSPRETWPDDSACDEAIAEAETFGLAIWEIAEKYDVPLTNNSVRWQEGVFVRHITDFIEDVRRVHLRFAPSDSAVSKQEGVDDAG